MRKYFLQPFNSTTFRNLNYGRFRTREVLMTLLFGTFMLCQFSLVMSQPQQSAAPSGPKLDAENAFKEGQALRAQRTPEGRKVAIEKYQQAVSIFRSIGDRASESRALYVIGVTYSESKDPQKAIEFYSQALTIVRTLGNRKNEAITLGSLGLAYDELGDKQKALDYNIQALAVQREVGD